MFRSLGTGGGREGFTEEGTLKWAQRMSRRDRTAHTKAQEPWSGTSIDGSQRAKGGHRRTPGDLRGLVSVLRVLRELARVHPGGRAADLGLAGRQFYFREEDGTGLGLEGTNSHSPSAQKSSRLDGSPSRGGRGAWEEAGPLPPALHRGRRNDSWAQPQESLGGSAVRDLRTLWAKGRSLSARSPWGPQMCPEHDRSGRREDSAHLGAPTDWWI